MQSKNPKEIEFICTRCKTIERVPTEIVEMLDRADQIGVDTSFAKLSNQVHIVLTSYPNYKLFL